MPSVSSVSDGAQGLSQFLQRLSANRQSDSATRASSSSAPSSVDDPDGEGDHHGVGMHAHSGHHAGGGAIRGKIESAVTDALKNYDGTGDVNQVIQKAIADAVQPGANGSTSTSSTSDASSTRASSSSASQSSATDATSSAQGFEQLLQSHGVDANQFRSDLLAAFQSVHGSTADSTSAVHGLTQGQYVDVEG